MTTLESNDVDSKAERGVGIESVRMAEQKLEDEKREERRRRSSLLDIDISVGSKEGAFCVAQERWEVGKEREG